MFSSTTCFRVCWLPVPGAGGLVVVVVVVGRGAAGGLKVDTCGGLDRAACWMKCWGSVVR